MEITFSGECICSGGSLCSSSLRCSGMVNQVPEKKIKENKRKSVLLKNILKNKQ